MSRLFALVLFLGTSAPAFADPPAPDESLASWSHEKEEHLLAIVKERAPERYTELTAMRTSDPVGYVIALHEVARMARAGGVDGADPRIAELQSQLDTMIAEYPSLSTGDQKKKRAEMVPLAGQLFDLRQEQRKARLAEMKDRIAHLETEIADHETRRDELIAKWLDKRLVAPK
jgi:hypothetical protein